MVPVRNLGAERIARRRYEDRVGLMVGRKVRLPPAKAAEFLNARLPLHEGDIEGQPDPSRFHVHQVDLTPHLQGAASQGDRGHQRWGLDVDFASETAQLTKNQILAQAGVSVLAQANFAPQMALTLLG